MRQRNNRVQIRMNDKEYDKFTKLVIKSGVTKETYIRHLINGVVPNNKQPPDYYKMMKSIYAVATNLNQIAKKAHLLNIIDVKRYDENTKAINNLILEISKTIIAPQKYSNSPFGKIKSK